MNQQSMATRCLSSHRLLYAILGTMSVLLAACGSNPKYVESGGPDTLVTHEINIQDFSMAAESMVNSLLASDVLAPYQEEPAILAVSRVVNNTAQQFDTDLLTKEIRVALNKSGQVVTLTTLGPGGKAEDELAKGLQQEREFTEGKEAPTPDYSLSGKIIETTARVGRQRQNTFTFQLALTDRRGIAVWEDSRQITKQSKRPGVGW